MDDAHGATERIVRESYGRLLAMLASRSRNIAAAEDALSEALLSALRSWPVRGIPDNPDAWMLTAARNVMNNAFRHQSIVDGALPDLLLRAGPPEPDRTDIPDERLTLMFVCAHPAIDEAVRAPLMLQTILGLDAARIAQAFLVPPATMGQRLVRAKTKIRDAGLRFALPEQHDMPARVGDVLNAIYAAYAVGWDGIADDPAPGGDLAGEALFLARLVHDLLPAEPEAMGLLSLLLFCEARRPARRDARGRFVPLGEQDAKLWSRDMIIEAEGLLTRASRFARFGRFQCEAAIQSVHVQRPVTGKLNHAALITLYRLLADHVPGIGARIGLAAVLIETGALPEAAQILDDLPAAAVESHQPFWVTRARLHAASGRYVQAEEAFDRAIALSGDPAIRDHLGEARRKLRRENTASGSLFPS